MGVEYNLKVEEFIKAFSEIWSEGWTEHLLWNDNWYDPDGIFFFLKYGFAHQTV